MGRNSSWYGKAAPCRRQYARRPRSSPGRALQQRRPASGFLPARLTNSGCSSGLVTVTAPTWHARYDRSVMRSWPAATTKATAVEMVTATAAATACAPWRRRCARSAIRITRHRSRQVQRVGGVRDVGKPIAPFADEHTTHRIGEGAHLPREPLLGGRRQYPERQTYGADQRSANSCAYNLTCMGQAEKGGRHRSRIGID